MHTGRYLRLSGTIVAREAVTRMGPELLLPAGGMAAGAGYAIHRRIMRRNRRRRREEELRERAAIVRNNASLDDDVDVVRELSGRHLVPILAAGTGGTRQMVKVLQHVARTGLQHMIGPILFIELDRREQERTLGQLPSVFRDRLIAVGSTMSGVGLTGMEIETARGERNRSMWQPEVERGAEFWLDSLREPPGLLLTFIPAGGSPVLARRPLELFWERYEHRQDYLHAYGFAIVDHHPTLRPRFGDMRRLFMDDGLLRGLFVTDNLVDPDFNNDDGLGLLIAGLLASSAVMDKPSSIFNLFTNFFSEPGSLATISFLTQKLQYMTRPAVEDLPPLHYCDPAHLLEQSMAAVRGLLTRPDLQALPVPVRTDRTGLLLVAAPIVKPDMLAVGRQLRERTRSLLEEPAHRNVVLLPASIPAVLDPDVQHTWLNGVLAQRLAISGAELDAYASGLHIYPGFQPRRSMLQAPLTPSTPLNTNGTATAEVVA